MFYSREEFIRQLGVASMPDAFGLHFTEVMEEYDAKGVSFLSDAYIDALQAAFDLFPEKYSFVKYEAERIRQDSFLSQYCLLLKHMLDDKDPETMLTLQDEPTCEDAERKIDLEMAGFFAQIAYVPEMVNALRLRNVPEHIIRQTIKCFETGIRVCNGCFGRDGYEIKRSFWWNQHYISGRIVNLGVLSFEIKKSFTDIVRIFTNRMGDYKILSNGQRISDNGLIAGSMNCPDEHFVADILETDDGFWGYEVDTANARVSCNRVFLSKEEWLPAISENDHVINIHIPDKTNLDMECITQSLATAKALFDACYPDFKPKAFTCNSWLMDPKLKDLLGHHSKIADFQSLFMRYPRLSSGNACFKFLFRKPFSNYEDLTENTSLQRKVKALYLNGGCIYDPCGVLFFDQL